MYVFLIRHGETQHNLEKRHQNPDSLLAPRGIDEINQLVPALIKFNPEVIFTSPYIRALKTAEIINRQLNLPLIVNENLREIKRPSIVEGKLHMDKKAAAIRKLVRQNYHLRGWHHSDEENFFDSKSRALRVIKDLELHDYRGILVVSHGRLIKMFVALIIFGNRLGPGIFLDFYDNTSISNGSLTVCQFTESRWQLVSLNIQ